MDGQRRDVDAGELREEDVTAADALDDRVSEAEGLPAAPAPADDGDDDAAGGGS